MVVHDYGVERQSKLRSSFAFCCCWRRGCCSEGLNQCPQLGIRLLSLGGRKPLTGFWLVFEGNPDFFGTPKAAPRAQLLVLRHILAWLLESRDCTPYMRTSCVPPPGTENIWYAHHFEPFLYHKSDIFFQKTLK